MADPFAQPFMAFNRLMRRLFHLGTQTLPQIRAEEARIRRAARIPAGRGGNRRGGR